MKRKIAVVLTFALLFSGFAFWVNENQTVNDLPGYASLELEIAPLCILRPLFDDLD